MVHEKPAEVLKDHFEEEAKVIVPKDIKVDVKRIPRNETKKVETQKPKVSKTQQYTMTLDDFEHQYHTVTAEESYAVAKFGKYAMLAGLLAAIGVSYRVVPAILRRIGYKRRGRIDYYSDNPELTQRYGGKVYEEAHLYTPKRPIGTKLQRTPRLQTP